MKRPEISDELRKKALAIRNAPSVDDRMFALCRLLETAADEIDRLAADAERYRWLREFPFSGLDIFELDWEDGDLDAAIDGEMLP